MSRIIIHQRDALSEYCFLPGENLLGFLRKHGFSISAPCGGHSLCGKCRVILKTDGESREVNACSAVLNEDCEVFLPEDRSEILWNAARKVDSVDFREGFGVAVDLGTTTVAVSLYDLKTGEELGSTSRWNAQKCYGADVISRIGFCMENDDGLNRLCSEIRQQILDMLHVLCEEKGIPEGEIKEGFLAGNTVMEHIFAEISPNSIAAAPYLPATCFSGGEAVELEGIPFYLSPCVAGYVGGDITAGLLSANLGESEKTSLFIDVGTNGEIVLKSKNGMTSCAVASGPAFEGAGIACGMPAAEGAIHRAFLSEEGLGFDVIGGGEAKGICGSGLLDLIACLLELGYIDESGCLETDDGEDTLYLTDSVYITQRDIRQLQLAKAAVSAGITRLTETEGIRCGDIDALYLSGGFGTRLNSDSAVRIGMLPSELKSRIRSLGNTSLTGAATALMNRSGRRKLLEIKNNCGYLELSSDEKFNERFVDAMSFPEQSGE